jgi:hypothetical protein
MTRPDLLYDVQERRAQKKNLTQIGLELGYSREYIRQICVRHGIPTTDEREEWPPLRCQFCGEPYRDTRPHGRDGWEHASAHMKRTGHHPKTKTTRAWTPNEAQLRIIALHDEGKNHRAIASLEGTTVSHVSVVLARSGRTKGYNAERDAKLIKDWTDGLTYASLEAKYGLGYLRIRQITSAYMATGKLPVQGRTKRNGKP